MKMLAVAMVVIISAATLAVAAGQKNIGSEEAKTIISKRNNVFLLDVRTTDEYRQARLKGSVLIPVNEFQRRLNEVPKNRPIIVYCAVGSRSGMVAEFLSSKGYGEVYNMSDGLVGWFRRGYPIER